MSCGKIHMTSWLINTKSHSGRSFPKLKTDPVYSQDLATCYKFMTMIKMGVFTFHCWWSSYM